MSLTPPPYRCARHPKVETYLKCAKCDTPICPRCSVHTSVGVKCRDCGTQKLTPLYTLSPLQALAATAVGLGAGGLAGVLLPYVSFMWFYAVFLAIPYGRFAGGLILRVSGRKLGLLMEIITAGSIILGAVAVRVVVTAMHAPEGTGFVNWVVLAVTHLVVPLPIQAIVLVAAAAAAVSRIRFVWNVWSF